jgi:hypothetical protein
MIWEQDQQCMRECDKRLMIDCDVVSSGLGEFAWGVTSHTNR